MPVWSVQTEKGMCVSYNTRDGWRAVDEDLELPARFEVRRPAVRGAPEVYMGFEVVDGRSHAGSNPSLCMRDSHISRPVMCVPHT